MKVDSVTESTLGRCSRRLHTVPCDLCLTGCSCRCICRRCFVPQLTSLLIIFCGQNLWSPARSSTSPASREFDLLPCAMDNDPGLNLMVSCDLLANFGDLLHCSAVCMEFNTGVAIDSFVKTEDKNIAAITAISFKACVLVTNQEIRIDLELPSVMTLKSFRNVLPSSLHVFSRTGTRWR